MNLGVRLALALLIAVVAGFLGFAGVWFLVGYYGSCPPQAPTCDLPMIAGFGFGIIAGPLLGISLGVWTFRWLGRPHTRVIDPPAT